MTPNASSCLDFIFQYEFSRINIAFVQFLRHGVATDKSVLWSLDTFRISFYVLFNGHNPYMPVMQCNVNIRLAIHHNLMLRKK